MGDAQFGGDPAGADAVDVGCGEEIHEWGWGIWADVCGFRVFVGTGGGGGGVFGVSLWANLCGSGEIGGVILGWVTDEL